MTPLSAWGRRLVALPGVSAFTKFIGSASWPGSQEFLAGISFGSALAPGGAADLSRHIALYSTTCGFSITSSSLNHVASLVASHNWYSGTTNTMSLSSAGTLTLLGGQLKFPASQIASADANTLDDYEEGTFTPTIIGSTSSGTGTYTEQTGNYTKIGKAVIFKARCTWTAHTGTGNLIVAGLPFTSAVTTAVTLRISGLTFAATYPQAYVGASNTVVVLETVASGSAAANLALDAAADVIVSGMYFV